MSNKVRFGEARVGYAHNRMNSEDNLKYGGELPESLLLEELAKRKLKSIKKEAPKRSAFYNKCFTIRVQLDGVNPPVFREFRVSGGMNLRAFADKVIAPVMGWQRSYHMHYFIDTKDGSLYGNMES